MPFDNYPAKEAEREDIASFSCLQLAPIWRQPAFWFHDIYFLAFFIF